MAHKFNEWLVGMTEGDGSFFIDIQSHCTHESEVLKAPAFIKQNLKIKLKWNLGFKIALHKSNLQGLIYIKNQLKTGNITSAGGDMMQYRIRNRRMLHEKIFPIFDAFPLLTAKWYDYQVVRQGFDILEDTTLSAERREKKMVELMVWYLVQRQKKFPKVMEQYKYLADSIELEKAALYGISPFILEHFGETRISELYKTGWSGFSYKEAVFLLSPSWIRGFIEADGSFYITSKGGNRFCHGFGISQKKGFLLHLIRVRLKIKAKVQFSAHFFYKLNTTNRRNLETIQKLCHKKLFSSKSLEFRLWERSLFWKKSEIPLKKEINRLERIREQMRRLR